MCGIVLVLYYPFPLVLTIAQLKNSSVPQTFDCPVSVLDPALLMPVTGVPGDDCSQHKQCSISVHFEFDLLLQCLGPLLNHSVGDLVV